jgi:hypothetical protein
MLFKFCLQVQKMDGSLYSPNSWILLLSSQFVFLSCLVYLSLLLFSGCKICLEPLGGWFGSITNIIKDPRWTYSLVFFLDVSLCFDGWLVFHCFFFKLLLLLLLLNMCCSVMHIWSWFNVRFRRGWITIFKKVTCCHWKRNNSFLLWSSMLLIVLWA